METVKLTSQHLSSNVFILKKDNGMLIIDCGVEISIVKKIVGKNKVVGILLTHGHFDHAMYAQEYAKAFSCKIFSSKFAKEELSAPAKNYGETFKIDNFENFDFLDGQGKFQIGYFHIQYLSTPGHCKSCMCFLIEDQLFAGDTLFDNGIGRTDLYGSSKEEMIASLEGLEKISFDTCHSGHGEDSAYERQIRNIKIFQKFLKR